MSQEDLAKLVHTKGNVIGNLEAGERGLSHKWLILLAPALGTRPGFLLDYHPDDIDHEMLDAIMEVPKEDRAQALQILKTFGARR